MLEIIPMIDQSAKIKVQNLVQSPKPELKHRAFYFSLNIIKFLEKLEYSQAIKIISDQLIRSATSIGANIIEAKGSSSKKEFLRYFEISLKSSHETIYWLAILERLIENKEEIRNLVREADEISKIISSSVLTMKGKKKLSALN